MTEPTVLDFSQLLKDAKASAAWPLGDYDCEVTEADATVSSNGNQMIKVKLRCLVGAYAGKMIKTQFVLSTENPAALNMFFQNMRGFGLTDEFFVSLGSQVNLLPVAATLRGRRGRINVAHQEWPAGSGSLSNTVKGIKPIDGAPAGGAPNALAGIPQPPQTPNIPPPPSQFQKPTAPPQAPPTVQAPPPPPQFQPAPPPQHPAPYDAGLPAQPQAAAVPPPPTPPQFIPPQAPALTGIGAPAPTTWAQTPAPQAAPAPTPTQPPVAPQAWEQPALPPQAPAPQEAPQGYAPYPPQNPAPAAQSNGSDLPAPPGFPAEMWAQYPPEAKQAILAQMGQTAGPLPI